MSNRNQTGRNPASPRRRVRRGGSVLEAALVLPILVLITLPMIEFAQLFFVKHTFAAATRDGARKAILASVVHADAETAVRTTMSASGIGPTKYTLTFTNASTNATIADVGAATSGTGIKVTVTANYANVGYPQWFLRGAKTVTGVSTMIKE